MATECQWSPYLLIHKPFHGPTIIKLFLPLDSFLTWNQGPFISWIPDTVCLVTHRPVGGWRLALKTTWLSIFNLIHVFNTTLFWQVLSWFDRMNSNSRKHIIKRSYMTVAILANLRSLVFQVRLIKEKTVTWYRNFPLRKFLRRKCCRCCGLDGYPPFLI